MKLRAARNAKYILFEKAKQFITGGVVRLNIPWAKLTANIGVLRIEESSVTKTEFYLR